MSDDHFEHSPLDYLTGVDLEDAKDDLAAYYDGYTGSWFERLADQDRPDSITASDIVAVSTLGVDIRPTRQSGS